MERVSIAAAAFSAFLSSRRFATATLLRHGLALLTILSGVAVDVAAQSRPPVTDPNVNMVRGLGDQFSGDPYLQRQNEPSIAVSTRNPCHLLAGANDYRTVDIPDATVLPNTEPVSVADAWLGVFKSYDCGNRWQSTLIPGYPQDTSPEGLSSPLKGFQAAADPTVRAGTNGLLYYSGIVFNRGEGQASRLFVARYQDFNDKEKGDSIRYLGVTAVADGTSGQFVDKPWMAVDVPRSGYGPSASYWTASDTSTHGNPNSNSGGGNGAFCEVNGQQVPGGNVYLAWARFDGGGAQNPSKIMFGRSTDCGRTFKASPISDNQKISQGAMVAIAPDDGTVYVAWREFARNGKPHAIHIMRSRDGGLTWDKPQPVVASITPFDQAKTEFTFRTNALPTIAAAPGGLVYVAYAARGAAKLRDANGNLQPTDDARIMLVVSSNFGQTFAAPVAIDNPPDKRGHQIMPALSYAAGKLQILFYDFRDDGSPDRGTWISDNPSVTSVRHTVDVRGAWADATATPQFYVAGGTTQTLSQYAVSASLGTVQINYANLPLYGLGKMPFLGDYIDAQGLMAVPIRSADGTTQEWRPNIGPIDFTGLSALNAQAFPSLPVFHVTWTDHRDVKLPPGNAWDKYTAPGATTCDPTLAGIRNANIYTSRVTTGLFAGSPGNTKPLGTVLNPKTGQRELLQRGFAAFVQNTLTEPKRYRLTIVNQPAGGVASFRQFDRPAPGCQPPAPCPAEPLTTVEVEILRRSTIARTAYVKAPDQYAQVLVNIVEVDRVGREVTVDGRKTTVHDEVPNGLRTSVLLNPDKTNPPIANPDVVIDPGDPTSIPEIAQTESHDPAISPPFYVDVKGLLSTKRAIAVPKNPDPENPDPENPDPENPDPENPDVENPDPENPDPENPDPENPDPENPDPENPDVENPDVENLPPGEAITAIRDVHWTVKNRGNTTSAYHFRPTIKPGVDTTGLHFQLLVTRRYLVPALTSTCKVVYRTESQVIVNVPGYTPRTPDPENPDPENPDPENPDPENPDPENPDPENPDPENVSFILAPDESATVTLRIVKAGPGGGDTSTLAAGPAIGGIPDDVIDAIQGSGGGIDFSPRQQTGAVVTPQAADTGQTAPTSASAGPDLVLSDPMPTADPAAVVPPGQITLLFTIHNRGTGEAIAYVNGTPPSTTTIKTRFYLSTDDALSRDDVPLVAPGYAGDPYAFIHELSGSIPPCTEAAPTACLVPRTQALAIPRTTLAGQYYIFAIVDDDNDWDDDTSATVDNEVFEADDDNNRASVGPITIGYALAFTVQPVDTTQDMYITPMAGGTPLAVTVTATYGDGTPITDPALVSQISVSLGSNPAGGTLSGTLVRPLAGGFATFTDLSVNNPSPANTTYTLVAGAANSFGVTSGGFAILADAPPVVANDNYSMFEDGRLEAPMAGGLLINDRDPTFKGTKQPARNPRPSPGCPDGWCIQASLGTSPAQGVLAFSPDGSFTYDPPTQFNGAVTFTYVANDGRPGNNTTGTVTITVVGVNDPPSFTKGADQSVAEDSGAHSVSGWATGISAGPGESTQTVDFIVSAANPALFTVQPAIGATGTLTFTPVPNANGATTVTVRLHDNGGTANGGTDTSADQTFLITVTEANDPPVPAPDSRSTPEDTALAFPATDLAANDSAGPANEVGQALSVTQVAAIASTHGTVSLAGGTVTYTPDANYNGPASFSYTVCDNGTTSGAVDPKCATGTVNVTVTTVNDAPVPAADARTTSEDTALTLAASTLATNDAAGPADESGQALAVTAVVPTGSTNGTVSLAAGSITYTPAANYNGTASFTYSVCDDGTTNGVADPKCATGTVNVSVGAVNDPPVAVNDSAATPEDTPVTVSVLANDTDPEGDPLTVTGATAPTGTVTVNAGTTVTYRPATNFNGLATFTYTISDGHGGTASATVTVTVTGVNDPPVAANDAATTSEDTAVTVSVLANDTDPDGNVMTVTGATPVTGGGTVTVNANNTVTYTPAANYNGAATFSYTISDGFGGTASATVTVTVTPVNDNPDAVNDTFTVAEDSGATTLNVRANDTIAPDTGETLTVTAVTQPASGTVTIAAGGTGVIYTPPANFNGVVSFSYTISDGNGGIDTASITVTVTPVNDAPVAVGDSYIASDNDPLTIAAPGVLANDTDVDGDALTAVLVKDVVHGTLTLNANGSFTFVPHAGFVGADNFRYRASDGSLASGTVDVNITVEANEFPVANPDSATTPEDTAAVIGVLANDTDPDLDVLTVSAVTSPAHGTATITGGGTTVTYQPALNFNGADSFTYTVSDGLGGTATAAVTVSVTAVNDAPVAVNDSAVAIAGSTVPIDVLANDYDVESRAGLSVASSVRFDPPGMTTNPGPSNELAVVPNAGRLYVSTTRAIAVYSLATNALDRLIPLQGQAGAGLNRLDATAGILYFRHGSAITAVDVRPTSPTFNQILTSLTFGSGITSFAVDDVQHRVYVVHPINAGGAPAGRQLAVVDGDPASPSFLAMVAGVPMPGTPIGVAANGVTNKIYVASSNANTSLSGVYVVDGATLAVTRITLADGTTGAPACFDVVVDPSTNMVYGYGTATPDGNIVAVDTANGNAVTTIPVANFWSVNWVGKMLAVNTVTHRVYAWSGDFYSPGKLVVIDANRSHGAAFNTVIAEIQTEIDYCDVVVDETNNRVITTGDMGAIVINGATNTVAGIVRGKQLTCDIAVSPVSRRAYVVNSGAGFQVVDYAGTPAEVAAIVTGTETGAIVVDPARHAAYTTRTSGAVSILALDRSGGVSQVPGLPTDSGRFLAMARNATTRKIYAANYAAGISGGLPLPGYVAVIDGATGAVIKNVVVGDQPLGIGINEATNRIYVANYGSLPGSVSVIDGGTDTVLATVTEPSESAYFLRDVVANTTTNKIYLRSNTSLSPLWVLDGASHALSAVGLPAGTATVSIIRVNSEKNRIYVGMSNGTLYVLNGADNSIVTALNVGYPSSAVGTQSYVAINETTDEVFVANFLNDNVTILDFNGGLLATVDVGDGPTAVAVDPTKNRVYVSSANDRMLAIIDGGTRALRGALALPHQANFIALDPTDSRLYTSTGGPADVGLMVIADEPAGPEGTLTVNYVSPAGRGTTQVILDRLVLYRPTAGASGVDTFTYTVSDGTLTSSPATVTVTVAPALTITTSSLANGRTGQPYSQTIAATGGTGARTWLMQSGSLPAGTALDGATGTIRGTPTAAGAYTFTARVQDSAAVPQVATQVFTIGIGPLVITTGSLPSGWIGQPYSATLSAVPITGTAVWSLASGSLPTGLTLSSSGVITGTSTVYGTSSFTVQVTDGSGDAATRSLSLFMDAPLAINALQQCVALESCSGLGYVGGRGTRQWTVSGTLPRGLSFSSTYGVTGTALETGYFPLTLTLTDCANNSCSAGTPTQTDTKTVTLGVSAREQQLNGDGVSMVSFGTAGYSRVATIVTAGATGDLVAVQPRILTCPSGTPVTFEIRRLTSTPPFVPDDSVDGLYVSTTVMSGNTMILLPTPVFLPVGARFAIVMGAAGACQARTNVTSDSNIAAEPYVFDGSWHQPSEFLELGMDTLVVPQAGLAYTNTSRSNVVIVPLLDNRLLVLSDQATAEVYDPATRQFTPTANNLQASRNQLAAVLLRCQTGTTCGYHGKVLVAGGEYYDSTAGRWLSLNSAELYDPATNRFTPLAGTLSVGRSQFTMTRLLDGTLLVAGGQTRDPATGSWSMTRAAEIFDPATMSFTRTNDMVLARRMHTATFISCNGCPADGNVLVVGGWTNTGGTTAELFEPAGFGGTFQATTAGTVDGFQRSGHTATPLANGNVVIAGGIGWWPELGDTIEIYDVATDRFTRAGTVAARRMNQAAVPLSDGRVLLAGGWDRWFGPSLPLASVEIYDPQTQSSTAAPNLIVTRGQEGAVRLACPESNPGCAYADDVLVIGGGGGGGASWLSGRSAETLDVAGPTTGLAITTVALPDGQTGQPYAGTTLAAAGGTSPYTFSLAAGSLPPGIVLEPTTGLLHSLPGGDPSTPGGYQFIAKVTDALGARGFRNLQIRINALTIVTSSVASGVVNQPYEVTLAATGTAPFVWSFESSGGTTPPGLSVTADGRITGTPTQNGCWNFGVRVRDGSYQTATKGIDLCVNQLLQINVPSAPFTLLVNQWLDNWMNTNGGGSQRTWSLALQPGEHLPLGLEFTSQGRLFGNVREAGVVTVTVRATDNSLPPQSATGQITFRVGGEDQTNWDVNTPLQTLPIDSGHQVAQVVRAGVTGLLLRVEVPVACTSGDLIAEIRGVTSAGAPDDTVRASVVVPGAQLPPFQSYVPFRTMELTTPPSLSVNEHFAFVLRSSGSCAIAQISETQPGWWTYPYGDGFTGDGTTWTSLRPTTRPVLPFRTAMDPEKRLAFGHLWRSQHTATTLQDGTILLAGGTGNGHPNAVIYDPAAGTYTPTAGEMIVPRSSHTATLLPDGSVLIAGGDDCSQPNCPAVSAVELYNPVTRTFTQVASLLTVRTDHSATLLDDGRVLFAGGITAWGSGQVMLAGTELYEPSVGPIAGPDLANPRNGHTATKLTDGRVLIIGGESGGMPEPSAEIYTPGAPGTFTSAGPVNRPRRDHTATVLPDGKILIVGGWATHEPGAVPVAELYDPATDSFTIASGPLQTRQRHTATLLASGKVLIAGGNSVAGDSIASLELYDPSTGQFTGAGMPATGRTEHTATRLADGRVLLAFGYGSSNIIGISSEIYDPAAPPPAGPITIQTADPPKAYSGQAYNVQLTAVGTGPFTWSLAPGSQPLPAGLSLTSDGRITGSPAEPAGWPVYPFTVRAIDAAGHSTTQSFSLIVEQALEIMSASQEDAVVSEWYGGCLWTTGGSGPITFSVASGAPPPGVTLSFNGCWSGSIKGFGTYSFTVQATDSGLPPQTVTKALVLRTWVPEESGPGGPWQNAVTIGGPEHRRLAQVVTAAAFGGLAGVRLPVSCSDGSLTVEIQAVTAATPFLPANMTLLGPVVAPDNPSLPILFGATKFMAPDDRVAIVLSSTGTCQINALWTNEGYNGGEAWTDTGGGWQPLADLNFPDLNFLTLIAPARDFIYTSSWQWGDASVALDDGRVVMVSGNDIEMYDPTTGFTTPGPMLAENRSNHSVTKLADGRVAIIGGEFWDQNTSSTAARDSVEIYDPATGQLSMAPGRLTFPRSQHTATALPNGKVLIAGGWGPPDWNQGGYRPMFIAAELFDSSTGQVTALTDPANLMVDTRWGHRATALADGTVLITGGWSDSWPTATAEIFDPVTNTFAATQPMVAHRATHTATRLADGKVLITGGWGVNFPGWPSTSEIYDPSLGTFTATGPMLNIRQSHAAVLLVDGSVLIAGGNDTCCGQPWHAVTSLERYDPGSGLFVPAGSLGVVRDNLAMVRLDDGRMAIVGGGGSMLSYRTMEIYAPSSTVAITTTSLPDALKDVAYSSPSLTAAGGTTPYHFSVVSGSLPPGLTLAGDVIAGTPTAWGTYRFTVKVADSADPALSNYQLLAIRVSPIDITTTDLPRGYTGTPYSAQLTATGVGAVTWSLVPGVGSLPDGVTLSPTGAITGTPLAGNSFTFEVRAEDSVGQIATKMLTIQIDWGLFAQTTSLNDAEVAGGISDCLSTTGGAGPVFWAIVGGSLPPGVTLLPGGCFNGSIENTGIYTFTAQVVDSSVPQQTATREFTVRVAAQDQGSCCAWSMTDYDLITSSQLMAEVLTAGVSGQLTGLRMPVACAPGSDLTVGIYGVVDGHPDYRPQARLAERTIPGNLLPVMNVSGPPTDWQIALPSPVAIPRGGRFAVVLSSNGTCGIVQILDWPDYEPYPWGEGFHGDGITWTPLPRQSPNHRDLQFSTFVLPSDPFAYFPDGGRMWHTATPFGSGKILIAGMNPSGSVYDAATGVFTRTMGNMVGTRTNHTATPLGSDILLVGGRDPNQSGWPPIYTAELYHPASDTFEAVGPLAVARERHTATLLEDGRVLVAGGTNRTQGSLQSTEFYDPVNRTFSGGPSMKGSRHDHTATLLDDGRVLIVGGWGGYPTNAEIYDPATNSFGALTGDFAVPRTLHTATRLPDGTVLIAGGIHPHTRLMIPFAEVFDPLTNTSRIAGYLQQPRLEHAAALLANGRVLLAGGRFSENGYAEAGAEIYNPADETFAPAGDMRVARLSFTATTLSDSKVLLAGANGRSWVGPNSAEIYDPSIASSLLIATTSLPDAVIGEAYSGTIVAPGAVSYTVVFGNLPPGLPLNGATGAILGTPSVTGAFDFVVEVADGAPTPHRATRGFTIRINGPLDLQGSLLPAAAVGQLYSTQLTAVGGAGARTWRVGSGSFPPGLTLDNTGRIVGTPVSGGTYSFYVQVSDTGGHSDQWFFQIDVSATADISTAWTTTFPAGGQLGWAGLVVDPHDASTVLAAPTWRGIFKHEAGGAWGNLFDQTEQLPFDRMSIQAVTLGPDGAWYLAVQGNIFRSADRGASWTRLWNMIAGWARYILPVSSNVIYAAGESVAITKTTDGGWTWTAASTGLTDRVISLVANAGGTVLYAGTTGIGIYQSTNGGATWTAMPGASTMRRVASILLDPITSGVMYAAAEDLGGAHAFFKTIDGGASWTALPLSVYVPGGEFASLLAIDPDGTLYGLVGPAGNSVLVSTDGGQSWSETILQRFGAPMFGMPVSVAVADGATAYVATTEQGVYATHDSGGTWVHESAGMLAYGLPHSMAHSVHVDVNNASVIYAGTWGGGYRSTDGGATWSPMFLPEHLATTIVTHPSAPGLVYALNGDLYKSTDWGATWSLPGGGQSTVCCGSGDLVIDPNNASILYRGVIRTWTHDDPSNGVYKSTDGGLNWTAAGLVGLFVHTLAIDPHNGNVVYAGVGTNNGPTSGIFKTTDGGASWEELGGGLPADMNPNQIVVHPLDSNLVFIGSETNNGGVYRSTNAGATWTQIHSENVNSIAVDPSDPNVIYAATWDSGGFYRTTDGGATWTRMNEGLPQQPGLESIALDPSVTGRMFLGTVGGVYVRRFVP